MKLTFKILVAMLILGLAGVAQAKGQKNQSGIKGKIVGVSLNSITITEKGIAGQVTIKVDANTTIEVDGVSGKKVTDLQAGERVIIQGGTDGPATDISAKSHKGGKHKAAA
jgi:hypothetical protein